MGVNLNATYKAGGSRGWVGNAPPVIPERLDGHGFGAARKRNLIRNDPVAGYCQLPSTACSPAGAYVRVALEV